MIFYGPAFPKARADERGYDGNPDDLLPPAAHLMPAPGVDVLAVFAAEVEAAREAAEARWSA